MAVLHDQDRLLLRVPHTHHRQGAHRLALFGAPGRKVIVSSPV
jgi:hypothetical protein